MCFQLLYFHYKYKAVDKGVHYIGIELLVLAFSLFMIALFLHYIYRMNFPTVFIFYMNIYVAVGSEFTRYMYYLVQCYYNSSYIISVVIVIISIGGQNHLFCYSKSLMESLQLVTPYCIFTGNFTL